MTGLVDRFLGRVEVPDEVGDPAGVVESAVLDLVRYDSAAFSLRLRRFGRVADDLVDDFSSVTRSSRR